MTANSLERGPGSDFQPSQRWTSESSAALSVVARPLLAALVGLCVVCSSHAEEGPYALQFDGVDDSVVIPHSSVLNSAELTVTAWVQTSQTNGWSGIVTKFDETSVNGWQLSLLNGSVRAQYVVAGNRFVGGSTGLNGGFVADGQWHHLAFVVDDSGGRLQIDGALRAAQAWVGNAGKVTATRNLLLGAGPGLALFSGKLDEVSVWSRALSASEIALSRQHNLIGKEAELQAYFRLSEGTGNRTFNSAQSGFGLVGTLLGDPAWVAGVLLGPGVISRTPDAVTSRSLRLQGQVRSGGTRATAWFEWGTTTQYDQATPPQEIGVGEEPRPFSQFLSRLASAVPIHFRAVASNELGVTYGADITVTPPFSSLTQERSGHTATLLPNGKVLVAGGYGMPVNFVGFPTNTAELFDPATGVWRPTGDMLHAHGLHTATLLLNGKVLVMDLLGAELYDPQSGQWSPAASPNSAHNLHTATLLPDGRVLVAGGFGNQPEIYDPATGRWTLTGRLNTGRYRHTATVLRNGRILVAGGQDNESQSPLASAELFDPATGEWTLTGSLKTARLIHTATLQLNGRVLVTGGATRTAYLASAERYDPETGTWSEVPGPLKTKRGAHTATLLPRGAVLVTGGESSAETPAEVLEPLSDEWVELPRLKVERSSHTATLLPGGQILLAGGHNREGVAIATTEIIEANLSTWSATGPMARERYAHTATLLPDGRVLTAGQGESELYSPASQTWSNAPAMKTPRGSHTATLLNSGQVLTVGGLDNTLNATRSAELFDVATGRWIETSPLDNPRYGHTATKLTNGKVLVIGGVSEIFGGALASVELYDPVSGNWTPQPPLPAPRSGHTATLLSNGKVLVAGGGPDSFTVTASANLYDPATGHWLPTGSLCTNRVGHRATLLPNGTVLVLGGVAGVFQLATATAETYDSATGVWTSTGSLNAARLSAATALLPGGRVLVAGGSGEGYLNSAELYDPATRAWTFTGPMSAAVSQHTLTVLTNGKVLLTGGWTGNGGSAHAELFNAEFGASFLWQPAVTQCRSPLAPGDPVLLSGVNLRGISGGSYGNDKDSPSNVPVVELRQLESEYTLRLSSIRWASNDYSSLPITDFPAGWAMVTVLVNGTPGFSQLIEILPASQPRLTLQQLSPTTARVSWPSPSPGFQLQETIDSGATHWIDLTQPVTDNGTNRFITVPTTLNRRFYRLIKP